MTEHDHGRVADDGTVFVRRPDGEEVAVGQWAAGAPAEGLAFFERKYEGLKAEAELLIARLKDGKGSAENVSIVVGKLRDAVENPHVVGDLGVLSALSEKITVAGQAQQEAAAAAKAAVRAATLAARDRDRRGGREPGPRDPVEGDRRPFQGTAGQVDRPAPRRRASRDAEQELWKRFSHARSAFDKARRAHFAKLDAQRSEASAAKEAIVAEAEELSLEHRLGRDRRAPTAG